MNIMARAFVYAIGIVAVVSSFQAVALVIYMTLYTLSHL